MAVSDTWGRPLRNLRVSVTDRCNLRCQYCMPERDYVWLPRKDILDFEEVSVLVDAFSDLGEPRDPGPRDHDQWRAARGEGGGAEGSGDAPRDRQPRHLEARALPRPD